MTTIVRRAASVALASRVACVLCCTFALPSRAAEPVTPAELPPSEIVPATPPAEPAVPEPEQAPPPAPAIVSPPPIAEPPTIFARPRYDGRRLMNATYALTGISWAFRFVAIGAAFGIDRCTGDACREHRGNTFQAFTLMAPIVQVGALGVVGFGAGFKGHYDAWRWASTGKPARNAVAWIAVGAVTSLVFLGGSIALRLAIYDRCVDRCSNAQLAGYLLAEQASDTLLTFGGGMFDYGRGFRRAQLSYASRMSVAPWSPRGGAGLRLAGRF